MRYARFGQTDLRVSRVCFGTWQFGGDWDSDEEQDLVDAMRSAPDLGINFFDTAQAYGFGTSKQLVGKALEPEIKNRRKDVILATKGGLRMEGDQLLRDASPQWLRQGIEESLRYLGADCENDILMNAGGSTTGPVPVTPNGGCPQEFPEIRFSADGEGACYSQ